MINSHAGGFIFPVQTKKISAFRLLITKLVINNHFNNDNNTIIIINWIYIASFQIPKPLFSDTPVSQTGGGSLRTQSVLKSCTETDVTWFDTSVALSSHIKQPSVMMHISTARYPTQQFQEKQ